MKLLTSTQPICIVINSFSDFRSVKIIKKEYPNKSLEEICKIVSYFIAPEAESMHSTGGAVDALIYDLEKDCVMDFGNNNGLHLEP